MSIKNVVIVGAGGNLGPSVLDVFVKSSSFNVTVLSREGSDKTFPDNVKVVRANFDSFDSLKSAFQGQDAVVSLVASAALGAQTKLIDAAIAAGVKRYIPSEFGSNTTDPRTLEAVPVFKGKVDVQDYLKSKENEISRTILVTGPFFDWGLKVGFLGVNAQTKTASLVDQGTATFSTTNLRQIGFATVKVLEHAEETKNQVVLVSSFETSQKELLEKAEKITGEKYKVEHLSSKQLREDGLKKIQAGDFSGFVPLLQAVVSGEAGLADHRPFGLWNEKLGLEKEDLDESIKAGLSGKLYGQ